LSEEKKIIIEKDPEPFGHHPGRKFTIGLFLLISLFAVCLWFLLAVAGYVFEGGNTDLDRQVSNYVDDHVSAFNTKLMLAITFLGSQKFLMPANFIIVLLFFFSPGGKRYAWRVAALALSSTLVLNVLKRILQRERPSIPLIAKAHGYSFPSGHTFTGFVFFGMLAYISFRMIRNRFLKWMVSIILFLIPILIAYSRVYLKLHFATDVIAGLCLGILWLMIAHWLLIRADKNL